MTDDYNVGTTLGIVGAGVSLYALKGVVDTVGGMNKKISHKKQKRSRRQPVQTYNRFAFSSPARFHL